MVAWGSGRAAAFVCAAGNVLALAGCSLLLLDSSSLTDGAAAVDVTDSGRALGDGASVPDGGRGGDGGGDGAKVDGGAAPCPTFAIFCDDFESGNLSRWSVEDTGSTGELTLIGAAAKTPAPWAGSFSLRAAGSVVAPPPDGGSPKGNVANVRTNIAGLLTGSFFVRFYIYLPAPLAGDTSLFKLGHRSTGASPDDINIKVGSVSGGNVYRINTDNAVSKDTNDESTVPVPMARWTCVELGITLASAGHYLLWSDGQLVVDAARDTVGTLGVPYDQVRLGFSYSTPTIAQAVFFDDVAVATQKIGCE